MTITKEQWQGIETQLSGDFGRVKLRADGYEIAASIERLKPLKFCIAVYVDGYIKGEWMNGKDDRDLKFYHEKRGFVFSVKSRNDAKKKLLDRRLDKRIRAFYQNMVEGCYSVWEPYWTNPAAFCRHIRKSCTSIELIKIGYGD